VKVQKQGHDWVAMCAEHGEAYWCADWEGALEAAYGHVAMRHPWLCDHQLSYGPMDHRWRRCLECGAHLPPTSNLDTQPDTEDAS